ncbi:MAG: hypothetical protein RL329_157 [Bacteroidota bacterium]|jgi:hypothetical protein
MNIPIPEIEPEMVQPNAPIPLMKKPLDPTLISRYQRDIPSGLKMTQVLRIYFSLIASKN